MSRGYRRWQCQPEEKGFHVCWRGLQASSFLVFSIWFSLTGPATFVGDNTSPITHFWAYLRRCFLLCLGEGSLHLPRNVMKEGLVCPLSTTDVFFPRDFWSHQPQVCLLLGTSNLDVNLINSTGKSSDITQTLHRGRHRWAVSKWTSFIRRKHKLKPQRATTTHSPERLKWPRLITPNVSSALEQLELSIVPVGV